MSMLDIRTYYAETRTMTDHVDQIAIATLYLLAMMIMAVIIRLSFRFYMLRSFQWDDAIVSLSLVFGISQSSAIFTGTTHGLGKRRSALSLSETLYASNLLYVLALSLAKVSVLQFLNKLCVNKTHKKICFWSSVLVAIWTIPVFFTLAFQCGAHNPWDTTDDHCINIFTFWVAISPIDILTELIICILPIYIVKPVQVVFGKKVTVVLAFIFRVLVIITTIVCLIFMHKRPSSVDMTLYSFETTVTTQCVLCISLLMACIPCLKPFLDAFDSGMLNVALNKGTGGSHSNLYSNSYALANEAEGLGTSAAAFAVTTPGKPFQAVSSAIAIQRTDQWSVRCEYLDPKDGSLASVDDTEDLRGKWEQG
ncbi:hypothetical protein N7488_000617 [Penicillium malachiteum]|nr:hypothetical protein N7488_000617 [Penicillium malachiteum]